MGEAGGWSLLERPDLQALVEAQTRRDTSALVDALTDADPAVRARAALGLGSVQAPEAVPALVLLLTDSDARVRRHAAFAIGQSGEETAVAPALLNALRREDDDAGRGALLDALGKTGGRAALAAVARFDLPAALDSARAIAVARFGLRGIHDPAAVRWLADHLTAADAGTRWGAAYYFGRMRDPQPWLDVADAVRDASGSLSANDPAQMHLALALSRLPDKNVEFRRIRLLRESGDWRVRVNAARSLAGAGRTPQARAALVAALDDPVPHVAITAATSLAGAPSAGSGQTLDAATVDAVERWAANHPERWRVTGPLATALARSGRADAAFDLAHRLFRDPATLGIPEPERPFARAAGLGALGIADKEALALLVDAAADADGRVAYAALEALKARRAADADPARDPFYLDLFADALSRGDVATAYAAAPALADSALYALGGGRVLRESYRQMEAPRDIEPMEAIVRAMGAARDTAAVTFLLGVALEARHPVLRRSATEALTARFGEGIRFEPTGLTPPDFPALDWKYLRRLGPRPRLVLETERGTAVLELDPEVAPLTTQTVAWFAERGRYDGVAFHRVVPNFVVQGGDFARGDGFGGPDFQIPSELAPLPYRAGAVGMASAGKDTEGSQFFVTHSAQPHLDGRYTAFGYVAEGMDAVDALVVGDRILRARVEATP